MILIATILAATVSAIRLQHQISVSHPQSCWSTPNISGLIAGRLPWSFVVEAFSHEQIELAQAFIRGCFEVRSTESEQGCHGLGVLDMAVRIA
jgi:tagatose-1,6-bisphosphate aldolase